MMISAVDDGAIGRAQVGGYVVGGKTGTAETGANSAPHAWFIGFIGNPDPQYAVAVVLEHGGEGLAAPVTIGRDMLVAAMQANKPD
jgi:peptidoglycan glycosyltransferase